MTSKLFKLLRILPLVLTAICLQMQSLTAQQIFVDDLCEVIETTTPPDAKVCLTNRSPNPSDHSYVMIARSNMGEHVFLLRSDLAPGGGCRPSAGVFSSFLCVELDFETPPNFDAACTFERVPGICGSGSSREAWYYNAASNTVPPGSGGVHEGPTERFFVAARTLENGDAMVEELGDVFIYRGSPSLDRTPLRVSDGTIATPRLNAYTQATRSSALSITLDRMDAAGVQLDELRDIGTEGRFLSETGGEYLFHGTGTDCDGACGARRVLTQSEFEARLGALSASVGIETLAGIDLSMLRRQLIDRLLMGSTPIAEIDDALDASRIVQPVAFLVLDWR
ncbi:hypothetical protein ACNKFW_01990 [Paracoccus sp. TD-10]|uniref:hypothetical protein n=1 Tax=Paracoccus sp. TD-10 TaxID=3395918 RepID=UPI003AABB214